MELINDLGLMVAKGLQSPFIAADPLYSPIAGAPIMTHRIFPGLSGVVPIGTEKVVVIFVDTLPDDVKLSGTLRLTTRLNADGEPQEHWIIQAEAVSNAWQFMTIDDELKVPAEKIVLCQWKPGALEEALKLHDTMIASLGRSGEAWLIGSKLEIEAHSRYILGAGFSSIAHPLAGAGLVAKALENMGHEITLNSGPCLAMKALPIRWFIET